MTTPLAFDRRFLGSGWMLTAEPGFCCDGPSVPAWLAKAVRIALMAKASILHDVMRQDRCWSKIAGDLTFVEACPGTGAGPS